MTYTLWWGRYVTGESITHAVHWPLLGNQLSHNIAYSVTFYYGMTHCLSSTVSLAITMPWCMSIHVLSPGYAEGDKRTAMRIMTNWRQGELMPQYEISEEIRLHLLWTFIDTNLKFTSYVWNTVHSRHLAVSFLQITQKRRPIARP